jgi:hypothetical protein
MDLDVAGMLFRAPSLHRASPEVAPRTQYLELAYDLSCRVPRTWSDEWISMLHRSRVKQPRIAHQRRTQLRKHWTT